MTAVRSLATVSPVDFETCLNANRPADVTMRASLTPSAGEGNPHGRVSVP